MPGEAVAYYSSVGGLGIWGMSESLESLRGEKVFKSLCWLLIGRRLGDVLGPHHGGDPALGRQVAVLHAEITKQQHVSEIVTFKLNCSMSVPCNKT